MTGAGTTASGPTIDAVAKEVRLALVLYGGVSLAIYEYGVTKELYKLVRAARAFDAAYEAGADLHAEDAASSALAALDLDDPADGKDGNDSELAYFDALVALADARRPLTVVLDVVAGTSAGGINGVCLARGLAGGLSLDGFRTLWIEDGDINTLLAGHHVELFGHELTVLALARAVVDVVLHDKRAPLDGDLMCRLLLQAFATMAPTSRPLVRPDESLDLYTTTTSVYGWDTAIPTGVGTIAHTDRAYRQLMHFHHEAAAGGASGSDRPGVNHLGDAYVPALAFAARATSSFPGAFPPVSLGSFGEAVGGGVDLDSIAERFVYALEYGATQQTQWYMDGGVLDNGPFDHAINAIAAKRAESETARELIYVEPDPGNGPTPESPDDPPEQPTIESTIWAARLTIPQHTSLQDALDRLHTMNADIASVGAVVATLIGPVMADLDAATSPDAGVAAAGTGPRGFAAVAGYDATLTQARTVRARALDAAGRFGYPTYCRLRAGAVADSVAVALADELGFPPEANRTSFIVAVLRAWAAGRPEWQSTDPQDLDDALSPLDVPFRLRRANFVLQGIGELLGAASGVRREQLLRLKSATWDLLVQLRSAAHTAAAAVADQARELFGADLGTPVSADPSTHLDPATFLTTGGRGELMHQLFDDYASALAATSLQGSSRRLWEQFESSTQGWDDDERRPLLARYLGFPIWDAVIFPSVALAKLPQLTPIGVARFSPLDARLLQAVDGHGAPRPVGTPKLDGVSLGHFGGFFARSSRQNDYLWGRLDAAELIMRMLARHATAAGDAAPVDLSRQVTRAFTDILAAEQDLDEIRAVRAALGEQVAALASAGLLG